jgi:putative tricarboxylic transport membrane protein
MGMFGISEILENVEVLAKQEVFKTDIRSLFPTWKDWMACRWSIVRGTLIGFFLGILPGAGVVLTSFFAYAIEKRFSKYPEKFGTGVIEGVAAPETANNAATAGAMIPLLALGVPASPTMAILLGAFIIHGIQPGPFFISQYPDLFWGVIASMYIGNIMLVILNLPLIGMWVRILRIPYVLLFPLIILFCLIGVYSLNNNVFEIFILRISSEENGILVGPFYSRHGSRTDDGDQFASVSDDRSGEAPHLFPAAIFRRPDDSGGYHPVDLVDHVHERKRQAIEEI